MELFQVGQEITAIKDGNIVDGTVQMLMDENRLSIKVKDGSTTIVDRDQVVSINGIVRSRPVYYQPRLTDEEWENDNLRSFEVYRHFEHCKEDYPNTIIDRFEGDAIQDHSYIDDMDYRSQEFFVDMPNHDDSGDNSNLYQTFSEEDARVFAQVHFGADVNGMICILSNS